MYIEVRLKFPVSTPVVAKPFSFPDSACIKGLSVYLVYLGLGTSEVSGRGTGCGAPTRDPWTGNRNKESEVAWGERDREESALTSSRQGYLSRHRHAGGQKKIFLPGKNINFYFMKQC